MAAGRLGWRGPDVHVRARYAVGAMLDFDAELGDGERAALAARLAEAFPEAARVTCARIGWAVTGDGPPDLRVITES